MVTVPCSSCCRVVPDDEVLFILQQAGYSVARVRTRANLFMTYFQRLTAIVMLATWSFYVHVHVYVCAYMHGSECILAVHHLACLLC